MKPNISYNEFMLTAHLCIYIYKMLNLLDELKMGFKHSFKSAAPFLASSFEFTS